MPVSVLASFATQPTESTPGLCAVKVVATDPVTQPIHLGLLMDTSGSMEGPRLASVKRTLEVLLSHLRPDDKITLVGFCSTALTVFNAVSISADPSQKAALVAAINTLAATTSTNLEVGLAEMGSILKSTASPLNALVVLTDGHINAGISSVSGLYSLVKSYFSVVPVYTLGYGADHNADLLKTLSARTHANYTFVEDEVALPVSMGNMLSALQTEVASAANLTFHGGLQCLEPTATSGSFDFGSLIADKPMWAVFKVPLGLESSPFVLNYKMLGVNHTLSFTPTPSSIPNEEILEQELRCHTAQSIEKAIDAMKSYNLQMAKDIITAALALVAASSVASWPLPIVMKAQLDERLEDINKALASPHNYGAAAALCRMTSMGGNYSAQRGVTQMSDGTTPGVFCSPAQLIASQQMSDQYTSGGGAHDPHARPPSPPPSASAVPVPP
jgi:hypothetical protein